MIPQHINHIQSVFSFSIFKTYTKILFESAYLWKKYDYKNLKGSHFFDRLRIITVNVFGKYSLKECSGKNYTYRVHGKRKINFLNFLCFNPGIYDIFLMSISLLNLENYVFRVFILKENSIIRNFILKYFEFVFL